MAAITPVRVRSSIVPSTTTPAAANPMATAHGSRSQNGSMPTTSTHGFMSA